MNDKLINEICNILNITYHHHKHFTDGVSSKVILINDYYLVKKNTIEELKGEIEYLNLNKSDLMQKVIYIDPNYRYVVFEFINGEVMHTVDDPKDTIVKISKIVSNYEPINIEGFGYLDDLNDTWSDFLLSEIKDESNVLPDQIKDNTYVLKCINELNKYSFSKCLLHGDFGTHNFIKKDGKLVGIIDPMAVIGDPLYDLLFAIVSNVDILKTLTMDDIYSLTKEDKNRVYNLFVVVLYARMIRCMHHHKEDIDIYIDFYNRIIL